MAPPNPTMPDTVPTADSGKDIGRHRHYQAGPRLLAEERDAEQAPAQAYTEPCGTSMTTGINSALKPSAILRAISRDLPRREQTTGKLSAQKAADARCSVRNPRVVTDLLDVEFARVVEILRQPEQQKYHAESLMNLANTSTCTLRIASSSATAIGRARVERQSVHRDLIDCPDKKRPTRAPTQGQRRRPGRRPLSSRCAATRSRSAAEPAPTPPPCRR